MAYFAKIDNGVVSEIRVVEEAYLLANPERYPGEWVVTDLKGEDPKRVAVIDGTYDADTTFFTPPSPYPSWILDEESCSWSAPVDYPSDGLGYEWDEATRTWILEEV